MMNSNDFRLGNVFLYKGKREIVKEIRTEGVVYARYMSSKFTQEKEGSELVYSEDKEQIKIAPFDLIEPIPITAEVLEKSGFSKSLAKNHDQTKDIDQQTEISWNEMEGLSLQTKVNGWKWYVEKVFYLHQFQNLYHLLTGKELKLKF